MGEPASFGRAMLYGLRQFPRVGSWLLLYSLMVTVGTVCCLLPGLYLGLAGSLVVPVALFRASGGIGESFRIVHANFGAALGRIATLAGFLLAVEAVAFIIGLVAGAAGIHGGYGAAVPGLVSAIIGVPASMLLIIGVTLTYAELSAREAPMTAATLNSAL